MRASIRCLPEVEESAGLPDPWPGGESGRLGLFSCSGLSKFRPGYFGFIAHVRVCPRRFGQAMFFYFLSQGLNPLPCCGAKAAIHKGILFVAPGGNCDRSARCFLTCSQWGIWGYPYQHFSTFGSISCGKAKQVDPQQQCNVLVSDEQTGNIPAHMFFLSHDGAIQGLNDKPRGANPK